MSAPAQPRPVAKLFSFPNPVNEVSARLVAGGVVLLAVAALVSGEKWLVAVTLESVFAFCVGCKIFAVLMRAGIIPPEVCESCNDIWSGAQSPGEHA